MKKRVDVSYNGRVQGVGFRYTAVDLAQKHDITGFVRNMPDKSVNVVAEGEAGDLELFLAAIDSSMDRYITSKNINTMEPTGEFKYFEVKYF